MPNFINKLNVLLQSTVRTALGGKRGRPGLRSSPHPDLGGEVDREIGALRAQIDRAMDDEDRMQADLAALRRQIDTLDLEADRSLQAGDEPTARQAVRQMQLQQQRLTMLEADLSQHRWSTSELIQRVNELAAAAAEARQRQPRAPDRSEDSPASARLRRAPAPKREKTVPATVDERAVEDDLAARRSRLSQ